MIVKIEHSSIKRRAKEYLAKGFSGAVVWMVMLAFLQVALMIAEQIGAHLLPLLGWLNPGSATGPWQEMINTAPAALLYTVVFLVLKMVLLSPLRLGEIRWYTGYVGAQELSVGKSLHWSLRHYLKGVGLQFQVEMRTLLWRILFCGLPLSGIGLSIQYMLDVAEDDMQRIAASMAFLLSCILLLIAFLLSVVVTGKYFLAPYIFSFREDWSIREMIAVSGELMHGHRDKLFAFTLSLIPAYLSALFLLPAFYTIPYIHVSYTLYAKLLVEQPDLQYGTQEFWRVDYSPSEDEI